MKVNFLVCGAHKGGTTALYAYLRAHPETRMSRPKELHFFDNDRHFKGGPPNYSRYHAFFPPSRGETVVGEATPNYMYWQAASRRIYDYNPAMKLIVIL